MLLRQPTFTPKALPPPVHAKVVAKQTPSPAQIAVQHANTLIQQARTATAHAAHLERRTNKAERQVALHPEDRALAERATDLTSRLRQADEKAIDATQRAEDAMRSANLLSAKEHRPEPFPTVGSQSASASTFEPSTGKKSLHGPANDFSPEAVKLNLEADRTYAKLANQSQTRTALEGLKVHNGESLRALGANLASGQVPPAQKSRLDQLKTHSPGAYQSIVDAAQSATASPIAGATPVGAKTPGQAVQALTSDQASYQAAHQRVEQLNQTLAQEVSKLSPDLTAAQKQAYLKAFHDKYGSAYRADSTTGAALAQALNDPMLNRAVKANGQVAYQAADAARLLAGGPRSAEVLQWAASAFDPKNPAYANYEKIRQPVMGRVQAGRAGSLLVQVRAGVDVNKDIIAPALSGAAGQLVAQSGGNVHLAIQRYSMLVSRLKSVSLGGKDLQAGLSLIKKVDRAVSAGQYSDLSLKDFTRTLKNPLAVGLTGAALAFSALGAKTALQKHQYGLLVQELAQTGRSGAMLLATGLRSLNGAAELAKQGFAEAGLVDRLVPGLGILANGAATAMQISQTWHDPSVGNIVASVGDAVATAGSAVGTVVPGVGQIIEGAGLVVAGVGGFISGFQARQQMRAEEAGLLQHIGINGAAAGALAQAGGQGAQLHTALGLDPLQIQELARTNPQLFQAPGWNDAFINTARANGIRGGNVPGFAAALAKDNPAYGQQLANMMASQDPNSAAFQQGLRNFIQQNYPATAQYVRDHSPALFPTTAAGRAALAARQNADLAYEARWSLGDPWNGLAVDLKGNSNPAYQAEIVKRLQQDHQLSPFIARVRNGMTANGSPQLLSQAIDNAVAQGVVSQAEAQALHQQIGA